ncbi:MAG TPA: FemAB family XrtA/PEP-CTERM system-associated protein [Magnetospirillum sp.]|jgi:FemAB-related protein (PEP-CTERM system-associated)|nr:FemAB family XrtA/PEP-CTERM system-associated protein [Magnetospirillum sp.]
MSLSVKRLDDAALARWEAFVLGHPDATFFHRAGWREVIERSFGHRTYYLYAEEDGVLRGVLPLAHYRSWMFGNALIANGCCMGGAPVAEDERADDALDAEACRLMEEVGAKYLEYRQPIRRHGHWQARDSLYATFARPMAADEDEALKQIPRKQRAVVRKALQNELDDVVETNIDHFYPLYALSVRNLGTPVFGRAYFRNLLEIFGPACDILTVMHQGRPISSVLSFYFRDRVMPYYIGSAPDARDLGANDFVYWRLMRRAAERGYSIFDFGRSKVGTGPYAFKKNWGFEPVPVVHEYRLRGEESLPELNPTNPKYRLFIDLWKRLPLPLANAMGPYVVRNIG